MHKFIRLVTGLMLLTIVVPLSVRAQIDSVRRDSANTSGVTPTAATTTATTQPTTVATSSSSADTVRRGYFPKETLYKLGKRTYADTVLRSDFKDPNNRSAAGVTEIDDCDTTFQTFVLVRRTSPWRLGFFAGPNFAYCGTWDGTFGSNYRDRTLYNGAGINFTTNLDYYLTRATQRLRFGIGTAFGYQNYFTRGGYRDALYAQGATLGIAQSDIVIKSRPSEDMFLTIGPVLSFDFLRSRRGPEYNSFIELGLRGGIFRTQAATITATGATTGPNGPLVSNGPLIREVSPSTNLLHLGGLLSVGVFFPVGNNWHLGVQAQGFRTKLNYLIANGSNGTNANPDPTQLYEFKRNHGGFSAGVGVRKDFRTKKLIPKAPSVCPTCDSIPQLLVRFNNEPMMGTSMLYDSLPKNTAPMISWRSRTPNPKNETFTARLHYKSDSLPGSRDTVIAQMVNTTDTTLTFPTAFMDSVPRRGFYYVTVHNRQESKCGVCMSEVATTSFAFLRPNTPKTVACTYKNRLDRLEVFYRTPYTREIANVCYCQGQVTQVGDTVTRLRYRSLNSRLALQPYEFTNADGVINLRELPADLAKLLQAEKQKIESGRAITYKGRRIRPQVSSFRSVFTVEELPCTANGMKGRTVGSFAATISDNSYTIIDLKPLTEEQRTKLLTPPAPRKKAVRRGGGRGRRDDDSAIDANE